MGQRWKQEDRGTKALLNHDCQPQPLTILIKDHKKPREDGSQPGRPLCLAKRAPNMVLSDLVSTVLDKVADAEQDPTNV